jgi:hypothetical protein
MTTIPKSDTAIFWTFRFFFPIFSNILFRNYDDVQEDELEEEDGNDVEDALDGASSNDET